MNGLFQIGQRAVTKVKFVTALLIQEKVFHSFPQALTG